MKYLIAQSEVQKEWVFSTPEQKPNSQENPL